MPIPLLLNIAFATQAAPVAAILAVRGRRPPDPYRRIAIWCCALMVLDIMSRVVALLMGTNLYLAAFTEPLEAGLTLWILAVWQTSKGLRVAYNLAIPLMGLLMVAALLVPRFSGIWDGWLGPSLAIFMLVATLQTLVQRTLTSRELLTEVEWFWVCLGLSVFWFSTVPLPPFLNGFVVSNESWVWRMIYIRAGLLIFAYCLVTWGVLCTRNRLRFSGPS